MDLNIFDGLQSAVTIVFEAHMIPPLASESAFKLPTESFDVALLVFESFLVPGLTGHFRFILSIANSAHTWK